MRLIADRYHPPERTCRKLFDKRLGEVAEITGQPMFEFMRARTIVNCRSSTTLTSGDPQSALSLVASLHRQSKQLNETGLRGPIDHSVNFPQADVNVFENWESLIVGNIECELDPADSGRHDAARQCRQNL